MAKVCPVCHDALLQCGQTRCSECDPYGSGRAKPTRAAHSVRNAAVAVEWSDATGPGTTSGDDLTGALRRMLGAAD